MSTPAPAEKRIPSLDGLRAISISLVLLAHLRNSAGFPDWSVWPYLGNLGALGVRVFFVISGFLITSLLVAEVKATGRISLPMFYFRRLLRIFPASYAFLIYVAVAAAFGWIVLRPWDLAAGFLYLTNYHADRAWYTGHLWSLSVEEQFYLLWPGVLALAGLRRGFRVAAAVLVAAPAVRVATVLFLPASHHFGIGETFQTVCDALATGCLLAGFRDELSANARYVSFLRSPLFWITPFAIAVVHYFSRYAAFAYPVGETLLNVGIALSIDRFVRLPTGLVGRWLNARPMIFIGNLSYSLYLWQQPFLQPHAQTLWATFPLNLGIAFLFASASYFFVEKPFLRLRSRLERRWRAGRPVNAAETSLAAP